jgi:hypothetical protein
MFLKDCADGLVDGGPSPGLPKPDPGRHGGEPGYDGVRRRRQSGTALGIAPSDKGGHWRALASRVDVARASRR